MSAISSSTALLAVQLISGDAAARHRCSRPEKILQPGGLVWAFVTGRGFQNNSATWAPTVRSLHVEPGITPSQPLSLGNGVGLWPVCGQSGNMWPDGAELLNCWCLTVQAPPAPATAKAAAAKDVCNVAVLGASGYTGAEVVRLSALHPNIKITTLTGDRQAGKVSNSN